MDRIHGSATVNRRPVEFQALNTLRSFHADNSAQRFRLLWGPAIANGAAILALANIVANSAHQDVALSALTPSLAMFGIGLGVAVISMQYQARVLDGISTKLLASDTLIDDANRLIAQAEQLKHSGISPEELRAKEVEHNEALAKSIAAYDKAKENDSVIDRSEKLSRICNAAASGFFGAAFLMLLFTHWEGHMRLEPERQFRPSSVPPSASPKPPLSGLTRHPG